MAEIQNQYLSAQEAALHLGLKPGTLAHWRMKGKGPPYMEFGGRIKYRLDQLDEWAQAQAVEGKKDEA